MLERDRAFVGMRLDGDAGIRKRSPYGVAGRSPRAGLPENRSARLVGVSACGTRVRSGGVGLCLSVIERSWACAWTACGHPQAEPLRHAKGVFQKSPE